MELIEGYILSDMIKEQGSLDWRRAVEFTKQIASALSFAHKNHIIHRDVKPHNILITQGGIAKITDFGIARAINSSTVVEKTGTVIGSVHYFSPEQARGGYVDEKSDIYSLGIVLYEMLTGRVPFDGDNPVAVALMHINDEMTPPSAYVKNLPRGLEEVVMKATDKFQINRFATADDMLKALEDVEFMANVGVDSAFVPTTITAASIANSEIGSDVEEPEDMGNENGSAKKTKKTKKGKAAKKKFKLDKIKVLAIILAVVLAIPLSILIVNGAGTLMGIGGKSFEAPDFRGMTIEEAEKEAETVGLKIEKGDSVYSSDYDEGEICSQDPDVSASVKKGKTISVNISKGMKEGTVPNIVGKTYQDAEYYLEKYDFKAGTVTTEKSKMPKDMVISQSPAAGEEAKPGSKVSFVISEGTAEGEAIVPLLLGKDVDEAKTTLEKAGLKVGATTYEKSTAYPKNQVLWQQYTADTTLAEGSTVDIKVSSGNEDVSQSIDLYVDYSSAGEAVFWLTVTISDESGTHNVITRSERLKENAGETVTLTGKGEGKVTVIFNDEVVIKKNVNFNTGEID